MPSTTPSTSITKTRVAKISYLNCVPFFRGLTLGDSYELVDCVPRALGERAAAGEVVAGPLSLVDYFRLDQIFERLGRFGIAVRGRGNSALLFSRRPIRQLDGAVIAVTEETSTTFCLLRLVLEHRYRLSPVSYQRERSADADALLLIGDEALRFRHTNTQYPFEIDVAFEWWLWQHLPFVFAVWAIRRDAENPVRKPLELGIARSLGVNSQQFEPIAHDYSKVWGIPETVLQSYLSSFIYRLSQPEEEGIARFRALLDEHHLL